ncbi:hypothetical protein EYF80_038396 [Liparis tanakae]|uniref:Uncharacterized protein n=1 Tax=Liparis tanakae TaxID=230148 RepID=A0A4Z2GEV5_9TELE|nr:hypothetical protein EYF80_038396 [Liparis tanakae]
MKEAFLGTQSGPGRVSRTGQSSPRRIRYGGPAPTRRCGGLRDAGGYPTHPSQICPLCRGNKCSELNVPPETPAVIWSYPQRQGCVGLLPPPAVGAAVTPMPLNSSSSSSSFPSPPLLPSRAPLLFPEPRGRSTAYRSPSSSKDTERAQRFLEAVFLDFISE